MVSYHQSLRLTLSMLLMRPQTSVSQVPWACLVFLICSVLRFGPYAGIPPRRATVHSHLPPTWLASIRMGRAWIWVLDIHGLPTLMEHSAESPQRRVSAPLIRKV